jgi:hypothetical protein
MYIRTLRGQDAEPGEPDTITFRCVSSDILGRSCHNLTRMADYKLMRTENPFSPSHITIQTGTLPKSPAWGGQ